MSKKQKGTQSETLNQTRKGRERKVVASKTLGTIVASTLVVSQLGLLAPSTAQAYTPAYDTMLSAGENTTYALSTNGTLYAFGSDSYGLLGDGGSSNKNTPILVMTGVAQVDGGYNHTLAVKKDGTVWAWGNSTYGELGTGLKSDTKKVPTQIQGLTDVVKVKAGAYFSVALKSDGTMWAWGKNTSGQLGNVTNIDQMLPVQVKGVNGVGYLTDVKDFDLGADHVLVLKNDGTVWAWGEGNDGQVGQGNNGDRNAPTQVPTLSGIISISAGDQRSYAVRNDGRVYAFGDNTSGKLGDGSTTDRLSPYLLQYPTNIVDIDAGADHTIALKSDGTVQAWGLNTNGQVGNGTTTTQKTAVQVILPSGLPLTGVEAIDAGGGHSHAVLSDGTIWSWGYNTSGQLGIGNTTAQKNPTLVGGIPSLIVAADIMAPTISLSASTTTPTNADVTITATVTDDTSVSVTKWAVGNQPTSYFASQGNTLAGNTFTASANGVYTVYAKDEAGNESVQVITISNIDKTTPTLTLTDSNGVIQATATDSGGSGIKRIKLPNGTYVDGATATYAYTANGSYSFTAEDNAGNTSVQSITITSVDTTPPIPATFTADKTAPTNGNVTVTINYPSDAVVKEYRIGSSGTWTTYSSPVVITTNDTLYARSKDAAGNQSSESSYAVTNIDKTAPVTPTLVADKTTSTNTNVVVTITYPSDASMKEYRVNGGAWTAYTAAVTMTANGTVEARGTDAAGNVSAIGSLTVSNIDKTAPTTPTLAADKSATTNTNVVVTITYPSDASVKEYRVNGGSWTAYTAAVTMTANGTVDARATDAAGNVSAIGSLTVSNIDKTAPTTPTLVADNTSPTSNNVVVTITYPSDAALKEYRVNGGTWTAYTAAVTMTANGSVEARATDAAGNVSAIGSLTVSNIDKAAPSIPTLVADKTTTTNTNVVVTITYPSDASVKEYRVNGGSWTAYTAAVTMTANGTVEARATDAAGNVSAIGSLTVSNIDKTAPTTPTLVADKTNSTSSDVVVTITYPSDASVKEYRVNGGAWTAYTAVVTMTANGTVEARATDAAGNVSAIGSISVTNIDKTAPTTPTLTADKTAPTNGTVSVTISFSADSATKEYRVNGGAWTAYTAPVSFTANGTLEARGTDAAGNVSAIGTYSVTNIDTVAPTTPTFTADKTSPTGGSVTVTISYSADSGTKEYRVNGGAWTAYTTPVVMNANGTIEARGTDSVGNVSAIGSYSVTNIDTIAPTTPTLVADKTTPTNGSVTVTISYSADSSVKEYRVNGGTWTAYTAPVAITANGTVEARGTDAAGNVSNIGSLSISNIDKTAPTTPTLAADKITPTNGNVVVTITYPADAATKEYRINGGTWTAYTSAVTMTANGLVEARGTDAVGNVSAIGSYTVSNIDKTAPTTPTLVADKTATTNTNVVVTITYPADASVKEYRVNGSAWTAYSTGVTMTANGTVEARATDAAGNVSAIGSLAVSNIDKTAPADATFVADITAPTNGSVKVTITYPSDGVTKEYKIGSSGSWTTYSTPVTMTTNDTIFARSTDAAGNISNVTSYVVSNIDTTAPEDAIFTAQSTGQSVSVVIGYPADAVVKEYKVGDTGTWTAYTGEITVTDNTTIYARSTDAAGNQSIVTSYEVTQIDKVPPIPATLIPNKTVLTNTDVTVTINYPSDAIVKEYRIGTTGDWTLYMNPVVMTGNGTIYARGKDNAGNVSEESSYTVSNIDKTAPASATFTADKTSPTNGSVKVTINYPSDGTVKEYKVGSSGTWTAYTSPVTMTTNDTIYARSKDDAGNLSVESSYIVNNIDVTPPVVPTLAADKTTLTNGNVLVTVTYPADASVKEYRVNGGSWLPYSSPVTVTSNGTVEARATDAAGNVSPIGSYVVSNIDKTAPSVPTLSADVTSPTKGNVTITVSYPADAATKEYRINGGSWTSYTTPIVVSSNGTIEARATDAAGNISANGSYTVSNIDNIPPAVPTFSPDVTTATNGNVKVTINYPADGTVNEYKVGSSGTWTTYTGAVVMTANDTIYARSTDAVGNVSSVGSYVVTNIDRIAPAIPTLTADITTPTNGNVTITITYSGDSSTKEFRIGATGTWTTYTAPVVVNANTTVYARGKDDAGNYSAEASYVVSNINQFTLATPTFSPDKTALTNQNVNVTITYDPASTVKQYKIGETGTWRNYISPVIVSSNSTVYAKSSDASGNISDTGSIVIDYIDKIDPPNPIISADIATPTNGLVTITIDYGNEPDTTAKYYRVGGGAWLTYTGPFTMSSNGTVYAQAKDNAGNISSTVYYTVSNIDKTAPTVPTFTPDTTAPTAGMVMVTINFPADAAVKEYRVGATGAWTAYVAPVVLTSNGTLYGRATDAAGNQSVGQITISNITTSP